MSETDNTTTEAPEKDAAPAENSNTPDNSSKPGSDTGLLANAGENGPDPDSATQTPETIPGPDKIAEKPAYIAEQFWDVEKGVLKDEALATSYNTLRKEFNELSQDKGGKAPEKAEDYLVDYKPPHRSRPTGEQKDGDPLDRFGEMDAADPVFIAMSKAAKHANISTGQFNDLMQVAMEELHPILPETFNAEKEKALLGEGADHMIKTNRDWIDTLSRNGVVNEDEFNLLLGFGATALGVQLTNKLRLNSGEKSIPVKLNGNANSGRKTPDECQALMDDDRYRLDGPAGDAYRSEVDKAFAETFGTASA